MSLTQLIPYLSSMTVMVCKLKLIIGHKNALCFCNIVRLSDTGFGEFKNLLR